MASQKIASDKPAFTSKVIEMWRKERGCDVTICCKDHKSIKAHSIVLRSVSEKIDQLLDTTSQDVITSETVPVDTWKSLLEIVYTGASDASLKSIDIGTVKDLAGSYEMETVVQQLEKYKELTLGNNSNMQSCSEIVNKESDNNDSDCNQRKERVDRKQNKSPKKMTKRSSGTKQKVNETVQTTMLDIPEIEIVDDIIVRRSGRKSKRYFCSSCKEHFATKMLHAEHACFGDSSQHGQSDKRKAKGRPAQLKSVKSDRVQDMLLLKTSKVAANLGVTKDIIEDVNEKGLCEHVEKHNQASETNDKIHGQLDKNYGNEIEEVSATSETKEQHGQDKIKDGSAEHLLMSENEERGVRLGDDQNAAVCMSVIKEEKAGEKDLEKTEKLSNLYCITCDQDCATVKVMCLYCFKVVNNLHSHLTKKHRYIPTDSLKIYSCRTEITKSMKDFMVFIKEPKKVQNRGLRADEEDRLFQFRCSKCSLLFSSIPTTLKHLKLNHPLPKVCVCKTCWCGFRQTEFLKDHKHYCSGGAVWRCDLCDKRFWRWTEYRAHIMAHHPHQKGNQLEALQDCEDELIFDCSQSQIQEEQSLGTALSSFEPVTVMRDAPYKQMCIRCGLNCTASSVKCHYCCQVIAVQDKLTHMGEVHPLIPQQSLWPVDCNKYYKTNSSAPEMLSHQAYVKEGNPEVVRVAYHLCALCNKEFISPESLKKHLSKVHKTSATCCNQCGLLIRSSWRALSKDHVNLCAGGDFVKCRQCGRFCGSFDSAKLHQMKSHSPQYHAVRKARSRKRAVDDTAEAGTKTSLINLSKGVNGFDILCVGCMKRCESEKPVTCRLCMAVVSKDDIHMKSAHPHSPADTWVISCGTLLESLHSKTKFLIGQMLLNSSHSTNYKCLECGMLYLESSELVNHVKEDHVDPSLHGNIDTCQHCQCVFVKQPGDDGAFEDHVQFCSHGNLHMCSFCEQRFSSFKELRSHAETAHKSRVADPTHDRNGVEQPASKSGPLDTKGGGAKRLYSDELISSVAVYLGGPGEAICVTCGSQCSNETVLCLYCFKVVKDIKEHRTHLHPSLPGQSLTVYSCNVHLMKTSESGDKRVSMKEEIHKVADTINIGASAEIFDCDTCHQSFESLERLGDHISYQFRCTKCCLYFNTVEDITGHLTATHHHSSVDVCKTCGSGFADREFHTVHSYYCQGGRLMKCAWCSWLFWKKEDFQEHVSLVHLEKLNSSKEGVEELNINGEMGNEQKPKKRRVTAESSTVARNPDIPNISDGFTFHRADYEEVPFSRTEEYTKVCFSCKDNCSQHEIQCAYCNDIVVASGKVQHMQETHPLIPPTSLWPIRCKNKSLKGSGPDILSKQVFMSTVLEASAEFEEGTVQLTLTSYECAMCDVEIQSAMLLKVHLKEVHTVDAVECPQCGMVIRSSCRVMVKDHLNLCGGGEFVRCKICGKLCGSVGSVHIHHIKVHTSFSLNHTVEPNLPRRAVGEVLEGKQGYKIICVNCNETCNTNKRPVKCRLCNLVIPKDDLHMKLKHPFSQCTTWYVTCLYNMFPEKGFYMGQKLMASEEECGAQYQCTDCMMTFETHTELVAHIEESHLVETSRGMMKLKVCEYCEGVFKIMNESYANFKDHVHFCGGGSLYKCEFCSEVFGFSVKLKRHISKYHPGEKCILNSSSKGVSIGGRQYVKVERGVQPVEIPPGTELKCAECAYKSLNYMELRQHNKSKHGYNLLQLNQLCRFCFKVFRKMSRREKHEQKVHLGGQRFLCEECGTDFEIRSQLQHHVEYHHKGQREVIVNRQKRLRTQQPIKVCPECGETFKLTFYYNQHIKMVHEKSLEYKCHLCGKQLSSKYKLKIHVDRHKGHKPFKCNYCSYKDYTGALVNLHIKKEHMHLQMKKPPAPVVKEEVSLKERIENRQEVQPEQQEEQGVEIQTEYVVQEDDGEGLKVVQNYYDTTEVEVEGSTTSVPVPVQYVYAVQYM